MRFLAFVASALAIGTAVACGGEKERQGQGTATTPTATATVPEGAPALVNVYLLREGKVGVARQVSVASAAVGRAALSELVEGAGDDEATAGWTTAIPDGTELEAIEIAGGAADVELSRSLDELATAQVVYTLTQFPTVERVRLEGKDYVRADFEELTPAILVEAPAPGERMSSGYRMTGTANTFEATFNYEVVDGDGRVVGKNFVTATSGSGTRGTFDAALEFDVEAEQGGELVVFELSAEDGSRMNEMRIPVTLVP